LTATQNILALIAALDDITELSAIGMAVSARVAAIEHSNGSNGSGDDELISAAEAAQLLGISKSFLYRRKLAFSVRVGRRAMFSKRGIERFIAKNAGK
jgi:hypothetical protein